MCANVELLIRIGVLGGTKYHLWSRAIIAAHAPLYCKIKVKDNHMNCKSKFGNEAFGETNIMNDTMRGKAL